MGRSINVASALKLYGYSIQREASEILASELRNIGPSEHDKWYDDLGRVFFLRVHYHRVPYCTVHTDYTRIQYVVSFLKKTVLSARS